VRGTRAGNTKHEADETTRDDVGGAHADGSTVNAHAHGADETPADKRPTAMPGLSIAAAVAACAPPSTARRPGGGKRVTQGAGDAVKGSADEAGNGDHGDSGDRKGGDSDGKQAGGGTDTARGHAQAAGDEAHADGNEALAWKRSHFMLLPLVTACLLGGAALRVEVQCSFCANGSLAPDREPDWAYSRLRRGCEIRRDQKATWTLMWIYEDRETEQAERSWGQTTDGNYMKEMVQRVLPKKNRQGK